MPEVTRRFSLRATVIGAATGVVSFTGLTIAADNSSALLYGAGAGIAALALLAGALRLRGSAQDLAICPDLAAGGPRQTSAVDSPHAKIAAIHSVETDLVGDTRTAKFGVTMVDRMFRDSSYATSTRAIAAPTVLESAVGERRMAAVEEVHRLPGAVVMPLEDAGLQQYGKALAAEIPEEIPPERVYTVPRDGIVSPARVTVCFCTAFAVFGAATGLLLPDTAGLSSAFSTAVTTATDIGTGTFEIDTAIGRFGLDALAALTEMAEKDVPGSTAHVLELTFYGFWTELIVLDEANAQRITYHASQDSYGSYDAGRVDVTRGSSNDDSARVRNTFPISAVDPSVVVATYDSITATLGIDQTGDDRVEISKESPDAAPRIEVRVTVNEDSGTYLAELDGTIAPIFDIRDTAAALAQVADALPLARIDATAPRIERLCLSCNSEKIDLVAYPESAPGDQVSISLASGAFPTAETDTATPPDPAELFDLSQITTNRLAAIVAANAARVGAEPADLESVRFEITAEPLPDTDGAAPPVLQIRTEFETMNGSGAIYLPDATFVATD